MGFAYFNLTMETDLRHDSACSTSDLGIDGIDGSRCQGIAKGRFFGLRDTPCTLPKTNIAPENRSSQKETSLPTNHFQVLC